MIVESFSVRSRQLLIGRGSLSPLAQKPKERSYSYVDKYSALGFSQMKTRQIVLGQIGEPLAALDKVGK